MSQRRINRFWKWFAKNSAALHAGFPDDPEVTDELAAQLRLLHPDLDLEVTEPRRGRRELTLSADGLTENFKFVERAIEAPPALPGWKFIAFRQPAKRVSGLAVRVGRRTIAVDELEFALHETDRGRVLEVFTRAARRDPEADVLGPILLLLDQTIGEERAATLFDLTLPRPWDAQPTSGKRREWALLRRVVARCTPPE